ncbi:MAG: family 1 glycosylhydrolase [bacterium]|nr:family 1 glycosylhydrolase [bacterium]
MTISKHSSFLWGVSTSAFQIEGQINNDITVWESLGYFRNNGEDPIYNRAADHWNRWESDFVLLKELNLNSYRFSVEWARIEPERGKFDQSALDQYVRMVDRLLELGIQPMLTLHHFTHPTWFHEATPWHSPESVEAFARFTAKVVESLGDRVNLYVTINEPMVWLLAGYLDAKFPPGKRDVHLLADSLYNMLLAHARAYDIIKSANPNAEVGIANNFIVFKSAHKWNPLDKKIKRLIHSFYNMCIVDAFHENVVRIKFPFIMDYHKPIALDNKIDFWGVNYYYRMHVRFKLSVKYPFELFFRDRSGSGFTDLGWEIYARGLGKVLNWLEPTGKPIYVTENGIATQDDTRRLEYMTQHLSILEDSIRRNPQVRGYYYWSLIDNYEWLVGYKARFGLYEVDYENGLKRTLRPSGRFFGDYIRNLNTGHSET